MRQAEPRLPVDAAPGHPAVLFLAEECSVRTALLDALLAGGAAVEPLASQDERAALQRLAELAARTGSDSAHRFVVGLGDAFALTTLRAASHEPLAGIVLIAPPPLRFEETGPPPVPTLLLQSDSAPRVRAAGGPIWQLQFPSLDDGWRELPPSQLHALTEAVVLWIRLRSSE